MEHTTRRLACMGLAACVAALALPGCGEDGLGECDMLVLGGSLVPGMESPHGGQLVLQTACAGGRCHSEAAVGAARVGVPAGLDFDVVPGAISLEQQTRVLRGGSIVREHAEEIWEEVSEGAMPPAPPAGSGELDAASKETLRNWLACGAEVIVAPPPVDTSDPWLGLYDRLMGPGGACGACHASATGPSAGGGFTLGDDACTAYDRVLNGAASGFACADSGALLVVPGNPAASLLFQKLGATPSCGSLMPFGTTVPYSMTEMQLVTDLETWIQSGAPKPAACP